jgi:hypothetical protein
MGVPFPSTLTSADVTVAVNGKRQSVNVDRAVRPHAFGVTLQKDEPLHVRIDAPTWSRIGEPADQGVRVDRMTVRRAR